MIGWKQDIEPRYGEAPEYDVEVIGLVIAQDFPDPNLLEQALIRGSQQYPDAIWVMRGKPNKAHIGRYAEEALAALGIEVLYAETIRKVWGTNADTWRDMEMLTCCTQVVIFHDGKSPTTGAFLKRKEQYPMLYSHVHPVVRGKPKPRKRKGRKPAGV